MDYHFKNNDMINITKVCSRCMTPIKKTTVKGYSGYCPEHDEDLYEFEISTIKLRNYE